MKKVLNLMMAFVFVAALTACGGNTETPDATPAEDSTATQVDTPATQNDVMDADSTSMEADSAHTEGEH